ncbi:MAG TPA: hypothetical protein VNT75_25150, partial [Symbiobacteriaceae bacterium]|nr:hypothetical protein [Symbiobacteriaceae bacterium]
AINPIFGSDRVARFFLGIQRKPGPPVRFALATVNGRPGVLRYVGDRLQGVIAFTMQDGQISDVFMVVNPDKLEGVQKGSWS